jgi:hypothetical protein
MACPTALGGTSARTSQPLFDQMRASFGEEMNLKYLDSITYKNHDKSVEIGIPAFSEMFDL